jgi:hypothetical protein
MKTQGAEKTNAGDNGDSTFGSVFGEGDKGGGVGDFGKSTFGDTNAVGDIFSKAGGAGGGDDRKKKMTLLGATAFAVMACLGLVWYLLQDDSASEEVAAVTPPDQAAAAAPETAGAPTEAAATDAPKTEAPAVEAPAAEEEVAATEAPQTDAPAAEISDSSSWTYDETKGGPVVKAKDGAVIEVSRSADFSDTYVTGTARNGSFRIPNPPPGEIFWREQGSQAATKITVSAAPKLQFNFSSPGTLAADGSLSWDASGAKAAFFRVELSSDAGFASPAFVFSTAKKSAQLSGTSAGRYHVRIGGYNEQAGQWQFSKGEMLEVQ